MEEDLYHVLGVSRNASPKDIQKAYRDLARKHHPDMNPDDARAKERFQKIQHAYEILNNPEKRELYDRYGSAFESMGAGGGPQAQTRRTRRGGPGAGFEEIDIEQMFGGGGGPAGFEGSFADLLRQFAGQGGPMPGAGGPKPRGGPRRGANVEHETTIPLATAVTGGEVQLRVQRPDGKQETIAVKIPAGIEDGKKVRVRGQGEPAPGRGEPGDLLLKVRIAPHPWFQRKGNNLEVRVPVTLAEAALGAKIEVPSPRGTLKLTIPPGTSSGRRLRAKGQGVRDAGGRTGDLIAEVQIELPDQLSEQEREWFRELDRRHPHNPRAELRW